MHHLRTQNQRYRSNISKAKCIQSAEDLKLIESDTECKRIEKLEIGLDDPYLEEEEEEEERQAGVGGMRGRSPDAIPFGDGGRALALLLCSRGEGFGGESSALSAS